MGARLRKDEEAGQGAEDQVQVSCSVRLSRQRSVDMLTGVHAGRSSTSARNVLGAPPPIGFVPFAGPPFPFYGAPFPIPLFPAPLYGFPAPPPPPSSSGFTAERITRLATPPSSPLSDVESMYENQVRLVFIRASRGRRADLDLQ